MRGHDLAKSGAGGQHVTLAITGFAANESFVATIVSNGVPIAIQTLTADATGTFSIVSVISAELADVVVVYTFVGQTNGAACSGTLTTLAVSATTTSTTSPPTTLAPTTTAPAAKAAAVTTKPAFTG